VYRNLLFGEVMDRRQIDPRADNLGSFAFGRWASCRWATWCGRMRAK